jgi:hypothetical protein
MSAIFPEDKSRVLLRIWLVELLGAIGAVTPRSADDHVAVAFSAAMLEAVHAGFRQVLGK